METNPNGANQYEMDPRQKLCWENYVNPKSETFGNATQSALKAGYEYSYADVITTRPNFPETKPAQYGLFIKQFNRKTAKLLHPKFANKPQSVL